MKKVIWNIVAIVMFLSFSFCYAEENYYDGKLRQFHPPATEAEKRLDYIIHSAPRSMLSKEKEWPHLTHNLAPEITEVFTKELIYAFSEKEKEDLDNEYLVGGNEFCVFNFDLVYCSHSTPDELYYNTFEEKDDYAIIVSKEIKKNDQLRHHFGMYKLVKRDNLWLLDGIRCWRFIKLNFDELKN